MATQKSEKVQKMEDDLREKFRNHPQLKNTSTEHILDVLKNTGVTSRGVMSIRYTFNVPCERKFIQDIRTKAKKKRIEQNPNRYDQPWQKIQKAREKINKIKKG